MPADHAHVRLFGIGVLETIGEPVRHGIAEHQHVALRHGVAFFRRGGLGKVLADDPLGRLLLEWREQIAAEPAATAAETAPKSATARLRPRRRTAEIEKLRGGRPDDPNQQRQNSRKKDFGFGMRSVRK